MLKFSTIACMAMIAAPLPAMAYSQADADACTPDAMNLCQAAIPDEGRVRDCLIQKRRELSLACSAVMSRPATSATRDPNIQKTRF
jgi:hypothetical protein